MNDGAVAPDLEVNAQALGTESSLVSEGLLDYLQGITVCIVFRLSAFYSKWAVAFESRLHVVKPKQMLDLASILECHPENHPVRAHMLKCSEKLVFSPVSPAALSADREIPARQQSATL